VAALDAPGQIVHASFILTVKKISGVGGLCFEGDDYKNRSSTFFKKKSASSDLT